MNSKIKSALLLSSLALAGATVHAQTYVGDNLTPPNQGPDGYPPLVIMGEYNIAGPLGSTSMTLPTGSVQDVKFNGSYFQGNPAYDLTYNFTLYALSLTSSNPGANEQTFKVVASESFSGMFASPGVQTLPVSNFKVQAGDFLAFAGTGPNYDYSGTSAANSDATYQNYAPFHASAPGGVGTTFTVGINSDLSADYQYVDGGLGRNYNFGVDVVASVPDASSTLLLFTPAVVLLAVMQRRRMAQS